jgi:hypothetical protein
MHKFFSNWRRLFWSLFAVLMVAWFFQLFLMWQFELRHMVPPSKETWVEQGLSDIKSGVSLWEVGDSTIVELKGLGSRVSSVSKCFEELLVSDGYRPPPETTTDRVRMITPDEALGRWNKLKLIPDEKTLRSLVSTHQAKLNLCAVRELDKTYRKKTDAWKKEVNAIWLVALVFPLIFTGLAWGLYKGIQAIIRVK